MIKLVLWDYTGQSSAWCEKFLRPNVAEIVRTLRPNDPDQAEVILRGDWDYVLILSDKNTQEIFDEMLETIRAMNFPTDKIISVSSFEDWSKNPAAIYSLLNPSTPAAQHIYRVLNFFNHRNGIITIPLTPKVFITSARRRTITLSRQRTSPEKITRKTR